jgi:hypothetical protein
MGTFLRLGRYPHFAKEHDIVINIGSSWLVPLSEAIVAGLSQKPAGTKPILIHISGAGNFIDHWTTGEVNPNAKVWNVSEISLIRVDYKLTVLRMMTRKP